MRNTCPPENALNSRKTTKKGQGRRPRTSLRIDLCRKRGSTPEIVRFGPFFAPQNSSFFSNNFGLAREDWEIVGDLAPSAENLGNHS